MNDKEILCRYRLLRKETDSLRVQIQNLENCIGGKPERVNNRRLSPVQYRALLRMQALNAMLAAQEPIVAQTSLAAENIIAGAYPPSLRTVLREYYIGGATDEAIAEGMDISVRYVNKMRNDFLKMAEKHERSPYAEKN